MSCFTAALSVDTLFPPADPEARRGWLARHGLEPGGYVVFVPGGRSEGQRSPAWIERQMGKVNAALVAMAHGLGEKPFAAGIHFSLADIAVGCALGYLDYRFAHIDWRTPHPNLARLAVKLAQRQSFIDTLPPSA